MAAVIPWLRGASICLALLAFLVSVVTAWQRKDNDVPLQDHLSRATGAGAIPSALVLVWGSFDPTILAAVPGINVPIAFGGMALLWVSIKAATQRRRPQ